jgi:hypothetical protein
VILSPAAARYISLFSPRIMGVGLIPSRRRPDHDLGSGRHSRHGRVTTGRAVDVSIIKPVGHSGGFFILPVSWWIPRTDLISVRRVRAF